MRRATFGSAGHLLPGVADEYRVRISLVSTVTHNEAAEEPQSFSLHIHCVYGLFLLWKIPSLRLVCNY